VYGLFEEIDLNAPKKLLTKLCKTVHQKVSQQWQENTPSTLYLEGLATYNGHEFHHLLVNFKSLPSCAQQLQLFIHQTIQKGKKLQKSLFDYF
jgi:hypothetical protein